MEFETEKRNPLSMHVDKMSTLQILKIINDEDRKVPQIIGEPKVMNAISKVVAAIDCSLSSGGHVFYAGAGTSGRLGVLDAAETVPTYGVSPLLFQSLIAGGSNAIVKAVEDAEDDINLGRQDLIERHFSKKDFLLGIAASGSTPYVVGALDYAHEIGAKTGALSCNFDTIISRHSDFPIEVVVGPEVVTGSTRMKAGTAQKLVLNMISTTSMINLGKIYENLMVDVLPTNNKLVNRAKRVIQEATGVSAQKATFYYELAHHRPKIAIVMILMNCNEIKSEMLLKKYNGKISEVIKNKQKS